MSRSALPQNLLVKPGTLIESFQNALDWEAISNATIANDVVHYKEGSQGVKLTSTAPSVTTVMDKPTENIDLSHATTLTMWIYVEDINCLANSSMRIYLANDPSWARYFVGYPNLDFKLVTGMNKIRLTMADMDKSDTPAATWDDPIRQIRLRFTSTDAGSASLTFCGLYADQENIPKVMIVADDVHPTVYSEMFTYMNPKGLPLTFYVYGSGVGSTGNITLAQLQEMYAAGCDIASHCWTHTDLTSVDIATAKSLIAQNRDWLISNGFTRSANHLAYPFGGYNPAILAELPGLGVSTARIANGSMMPYMFPPVDNLYLLPIGYPTSYVTLAEIKAIIDAVILRKGNMILLFHIIRTPIEEEWDWTVEDFRALVDYLEERHIDCITISEWFNQLTNPRYRSIPLSRGFV